MDVLTKSREDTARMDTHDVVEYLLERLGRTLTAYIANSRNRSMPARWATAPGAPTHARPAGDESGRLTAAHAIFRTIEDADNRQVACNWLISANPRLGGRTPAGQLRADNFPAVYQAASAFVGDTYYA